MLRIIGLTVVLCPLVLTLVGCTAGTGDRSYVAREFRSATPDDIMPVAERLLRREFGAVRVDSGEAKIESLPAGFSARRNTGAANEIYGGSSSMRQVAHFQVGPRGSTGSRALLRIDVERLDTRRGEAIAGTRQDRLLDSPGSTPIERDAATTVTQNEVWTFVRRNRQLERALLAEIEDALTGDRTYSDEAATPSAKNAPSEAMAPTPAAQPAPTAAAGPRSDDAALGLGGDSNYDLATAAQVRAWRPRAFVTESPACDRRRQ